VISNCSNRRHIVHDHVGIPECRAQANALLENLTAFGSGAAEQGNKTLVLEGYLVTLPPGLRASSSGFFALALELGAESLELALGIT
jgi:hypothetical protein